MVSEFDESEALQAAMEDWDADSHGQLALGRGAFLDSLFQLADVWTDGISAQERCTMPIVMLLGWWWRRRWW